MQACRHSAAIQACMCQLSASSLTGGQAYNRRARRCRLVQQDQRKVVIVPAGDGVGIMLNNNCDAPQIQN